MATIKYRLVKTSDRRKDAAEGAKVVVPQLVSNGQVTFDQLCEEVAEQSSLSSGDVKNCMDRLVYNLQAHLKNGQGVDAGDLGKFRVVVRSTCATTEEEYDASKLMKTPKVVFSPGKRLRDMPNDISYERVELKTEPCDKPHVS